MRAKLAIGLATSEGAGSCTGLASGLLSCRAVQADGAAMRDRAIKV